MSGQSQIQAERIPTGPRALIHGSDGLREEEVKLHQLMNLLHCLNKFQGQEPVDREDKRCSENRYSTKELRRSFLDGVCYLCDINTMGGTVTAAALRKYYPKPGPYHLRNERIEAALYLAANETILPKVQSFVKRLRQYLSEITWDNYEEKEAKILREALELGGQRMRSYLTKMRFHLDRCRANLKVIFRDHGVLSWIQAIEGETDLYNLSVLCYDGRGKELEELKRKAMANTDIAEFAHYIGRLGAHRYAVSIIVTAFLKVPVLRRIVKIEFLPAMKTREIILPREAVDFQKTCKVICKSPCLLPYQGRNLNKELCDRNYTSDYTLSDRLEQLGNVTTRVHAELLIVDFFSRKKLEFLDDDRYVGCSKPACYFCHKWISLHPGGFETPAAHKKVILACRGPDVNAGEDQQGNGARVRKNQYERITREILRDIEEEVRIEHVANQPRHQSSNGSTRAPSTVARL